MSRSDARIAMLLQMTELIRLSPVTLPTLRHNSRRAVERSGGQV